MAFPNAEGIQMNGDGYNSNCCGFYNFSSLGGKKRSVKSNLGKNGFQLATKEWKESHAIL